MREKWLALIAVFLLAAPIVPSVTAFNETAEEVLKDNPLQFPQLLDACQDYFYNAEYEKALACLDLYIELRPEDPVGYWRKLQAEYAKVRANNKNDEKNDEAKIKNSVEYAKLMTLSDMGIEKTEIKLSKLSAEDGAKIDFYLYVKGSIFGLKALFQFSNDNGWSAKENADKMLKLSGMSKYPDAPALAGLMEYKISRRGFIERVLAKIWFPTNRENGLRLIAQALHGNDSYFSDDIKFIVYGVLTEEGLKKKDRIKAEEILGTSEEELFEYLSRRYPRNKSIKAPTKNSRSFFTRIRGFLSSHGA